MGKLVFFLYYLWRLFDGKDEWGSVVNILVNLENRSIMVVGGVCFSNRVFGDFEGYIVLFIRFFIGI